MGIVPRAVLEWQFMRILAGLTVLLASILSVGCVSGGVMLQPAQQGEWSNFHNQKAQVSEGARTSPEKPAAEK
jgi:hypothetical protein